MELLWIHWAAIVGAGFLAGVVNAVVGSGTLITFPVLLLSGHPPVVANVSNTVGLVGGGLAGTFGYRRELREHGGTARLLLPVSLVGGMAGALALLVLPPRAFAIVVPFLVALGVVLVAVGPWLRGRGAARASERGVLDGGRRVVVCAVVLLLGAYGGYFGAAQGILIVGIMGLLTQASLQSLNGLKNLLVTGVNIVAAVTFLVVAPDLIDWRVVAAIAAGSIVGGAVGARAGRRLPPSLLRGLIVVVGVVAIADLTLR
ncbi:sulfite exporter TauE/SafE family protein [Nocardiopsis sp. MG754419]|uniref:sulfite exporter TauE/SafE family protein n=1 Tax=Nocardiopsis sp. MG754419 TaxID=2259865 RepID=UPI001BA7AD0A|nr:sulfite exporter TauE/SafE family protein [Nocardiopsis sp. MG754419]MBR8742638.1 sulfite exporter TauE/SafE family protein [Nocardiopsis sp. MG754419]